MSKIPLIKEFSYTQMPLLNFFYLSYQNQSNPYLFWCILVSFGLLIILGVSKRHYLRVARETERTKFKEIAEDMGKDKPTGLICFILYLLFLSTFIIIGISQWLSPYAEVLLLINFSALVSQLATVYYERETLFEVFIKPYFKNWNKKYRDKK